MGLQGPALVGVGREEEGEEEEKVGAEVPWEVPQLQRERERWAGREKEGRRWL